MSRLGAFLEMNCRPWLVDEGQIPARVVLERATGENVLQWAVKTPELEAEIEAGILMQEQELAKGCHAYRIVVYDTNGKQLAEMPKPLRGKSVDATVAGTESLALQRAAQAALNNAVYLHQVDRDQIESLLTSVGNSREDVQLLLDRLNVAQSENFSQKLEYERFQRSQERRDKVWEALTPVGVMYAQRLLTKFEPQIEKLLADMVKATAEAPPADVTKQSEQPSSSAAAASPEPTRPPIDENGSGGPPRSGRSGNHRPRAAHPSASPAK